MGGLDFGSRRALDGAAAYERASVERFFIAACEQRASLLGETAVARRRIADAKAAITDARDIDGKLMAMVLDAHRLMNEDARANARSIVEMLSRAAADAERIVADAKQQVDQAIRDRGLQDWPERPGLDGNTGVVPTQRGRGFWETAASAHERGHHSAPQYVA